MALTSNNAIQRSRHCARVIGLLMATGSAAALAQALPATPLVPAASVEEVVVTAQKKLEKLQDVPVTVTVLNTAQLTDRNQVRLQDYFSQIPGLSLDGEGNGQTSLAIRGVSTAPKSNPTVGILINDVPFGSSTVQGYGSLIAPDLDPADLSQIEILKGPQGTLYGANALGGLIKYVTAEPSTKGFSGRIESDVDGTVGGGVGYGLRGAVNIPIGSNLALRISGFTRETPGFIENVANLDKNVNEVNAQGDDFSLLWLPTDALTVKLNALLQHTKGDGFDGAGTTYDAKPLYGDLNQNVPPGSGIFDSRVQLYSANISLDLGFGTLTSVTGYGITTYSANPDFPQYGNLSEAITASATSPGVDGAELGDVFETKRFTQELRLSSPSGQTVEWLFGLFYDHESVPADQFVLAVDPETGRDKGEVINLNFPTTYAEYAGFGDFTYHFTDKLSFQGGVRFSYNDQTYHERDEYNAALGAPTPEFYAAKSHDHAVTFLATPSYKVLPDLLLYLRIASGYRPGGFNEDIPTGSTTPASYTADTTVSYELGAKGQAFGGALHYDLSLYDIEWNNIQIQLVDPKTEFVYFGNAGAARSTGAEAALQYTLADGTRLSANASYDVAELTQPIPPGNAVGYAGTALPFSPRFQGSASIDREFPLPGEWTGDAGATISFVDRRPEPFAADPTEIRVELNSYAKLDLRVSAHKNLWSVNLFANNVTDRRGVLSSISEGGSVATPASVYDTVYIQPATIGLSVIRRF